MTKEQPKIYEAIHTILGELSVEKAGTLPGHLGGKAYATAEDIAIGIKNLLTANSVLVEANEDVVEVQTPDYGDKKMRLIITIKGTYRLIHKDDGSFISISGIGQGLGTGVATAAAVASTFAMKSALQRTFLISDGADEKAGYTEQAQPKQTPAIKTAQKSAKVEKAMPPVVEEIKKLMEDKGITSEQMLALNDKIAKEREKNRGEVLPELLERLKAGEQA